MDRTALMLGVLTVLVLGLFPYISYVSKPVVLTSTTTITAVKTEKLTETVRETLTTTVYTNVVLNHYEQDRDINMTVSPKLYGGFINGLRIYLTNLGNTTKYNLKILIVTQDMLGLYNMRIEHIDVLEPKMTVRYDIDMVMPISRYYVFIVT